MRLSKEDYREAKGYLKRYNYNCLKIMNIRADIMSVSAAGLDGMPKAPYAISDRVLDSVIKLQENKDINAAAKEIKIVDQVMTLVSNDAKIIFEKQYQLGKNKFEIINEGMSERTYERRNRELIYSIYKEIKKSGGKMAEF